jgi:clan AA aspartic protease
MRGLVDTAGRALLKVELRQSVESEATSIEVWIDTGFTGDLVMPMGSIELLGLELSGSVDAILADGSQIALSTYTCAIEWFGETRSLEIIANNGPCPLLGVGLLRDLELRIDYSNLRLQLTPATTDDSAVP